VKPKTLIVLLLSFTISTAAAGEFVSFESGICKFNLYDYELTTHVERAIVFGVSRIVDTYKETFGFDYPDNFKVKVTIFGDKDEFLKYQKKNSRFAGKKHKEDKRRKGNGWGIVPRGKPSYIDIPHPVVSELA